MNYTPPILCKSEKAGKPDWFVFYRFRNAEGKMVAFKERGGINRIKDLKIKKAEASDLLASATKRLKSGWTPFVATEAETQQASPLMEVLRAYHKTKETTVRPPTLKHYTYGIRLLGEYLTKNKIANIACKDFTPTLAYGFSDFLLTDKGFKSRSHNNQITTMRTFFQMMEDRDVIPKNPFKKVAKRKEERGKLTTYSDAQKKLVKDYMVRNDHPMYLYVQLLYYCFIRPAEIMHLQVKHIDFEFKRIQVPGYASKNGKQFSLDIPLPLFKLMRDKYGRLDPETFLFSNGLKPGPVHISRKFASDKHRKMLIDLEIKGLVLYDWKHAGARDFILSGRNPYELMTAMRHHSLDQSMTYLQSLGVSFGDKSKTRKHEF